MTATQSTSPNYTSLHALVVALTAQDAGTLPGTTGELAHAAFYAAIEAVDPALSAQMHDAQERKDFSLSPLRGFGRGPADRRIHGQARTARLAAPDPAQHPPVRRLHAPPAA